MHIERAILIAFLGNYLINIILGTLIVFLPLGTNEYAQYIVYVVLAGIMTGIFSWWHLSTASRANTFTSGIVFGVIAFIVAVATALLSIIAEGFAQKTPLFGPESVLSNVVSLIFDWQILVLLGYWVVPSAIVGLLMQKRDTITVPSNPVSHPTI